MSKKSYSFSYGIDNLYTVPDDHILRVYDYYNGVIDTYQNKRLEEINERQDWDELQLAKERYSNKPKFTSQEKPFSKNHLLVAVRENGYLSYIRDLPEYDPVEELATLRTDSITEYMNNYYNNLDPGFFYFRNELTTIVEIENEELFILINKHRVNPLVFCESYIYDSEKKTIILSSDYYNEKVVNAYTKEEFIKIDGDKTTYFYVTNSNFDPLPRNKYPGFPIYKRIIVDNVINDFDTITVLGNEINVIENSNKVIEGDYEKDREGKYKLYLEKNNNEHYLHFIFTPKFLPNIKETFPIELAFKKNNDIYQGTVELTTKTNLFKPFTQLLRVESDDIYFEVPTIYTLSFERNEYISEEQAINLKVAYMEFNNTIIKVPLEYRGNMNNRYYYNSDPITLPNIKDIPTELKIEVRLIAEDVNDVNPYLYLVGYTTSAIYPVPKYYLKVEQLFISNTDYTEGDTTSFKMKFKGTGTLEINDITLYQVRDELGYFKVQDWKMEFDKKENDYFYYNLILDKKVFLNPVNVVIDRINFIFKFHCTVKEDGSKKDWIGESLQQSFNIIYYKNRWLIRNATIDNPLTGNAVITFKVFDKLLNCYTDKYSTDERLTLSDGQIVLSKNTTAVDEIMSWDFNNANWLYKVNINSYGNVSLQYKNAVATSNRVTIKHDKPQTPIDINISQTTQYVLSKGRIYIDLTYLEDIYAIYIDDVYIGKDTELYSNKFLDNKYSATVIEDPLTKKIVALGIDVIPVNEENVRLEFKITQINDYDYSGWDINVGIDIEVRPQSEILQPTLTLEDFGYNKEFNAILSLIKPELEDAQVIAEIINPTTNKTVSNPNFDNPWYENSSFESTNMFIPNEVSTQKDFILAFDVYEYKHALADNRTPNNFFYRVKLAFKVS